MINFFIIDKAEAGEMVNFSRLFDRMKNFRSTEGKKLTRPGKNRQKMFAIQKEILSGSGDEEKYEF